MLLSILVVPSISLAEDIYVAQNKVGFDNGSSCANAHSATWFNTAENWEAGAGKISGGDTAHLCGTITSQMVVQASGTAGNVITLLFESGAKISQPVCPGSSGCLALNNRSYITVDGGTNGVIENTANGTVRTNKLPSIGVLATSCSNCEIKNLAINNIYVHTNDLTDNVIDYTTVNGIRISGSNFVVHHNTIHDTGWAIYQPFGNDTNVEFHHNTIYNSSHGITIGGYNGVTLSTVKIYNNHIYDYSNWDVTSNAYHHDGIHMYGTLNAVATDVDIYNNLFDGNCGDHMTAHIYSEGQGDNSWLRTRIFNNVLKCTTEVHGILWVVNGANYEFYNNTVIGNPRAECVKVQNVAGTKFKNNVLTSCNFQIIFPASTTFTNNATDINYNTYGGMGANPWHWTGKCSFCADFTTWKTNCGCDANSTYNARLSVDSIGRPAVGSPMIGTGTNLSNLSISNLNLDKVGIARPSIGEWTVGAYHLAIDTVRPAPPAKITIQ
jgi:hypothetical protein